MFRRRTSSVIHREINKAWAVVGELLAHFNYDLLPAQLEVIRKLEEAYQAALEREAS